MKPGFKLNGQVGAIEHVAVASLIFDQAIYPRAWHSEEQVAKLQDAVASGVTLPPILVDRKTNRIVDGLHRWKRAQIAGDETILAELRDFADEQSVFETAIAANAKHGYGYFEIDREHILRRAVSLNISIDRIAKALCVTVEKVDRITRGFAKVSLNGTAAIQPKQRKPKTYTQTRVVRTNAKRDAPVAVSLGIPGTDYLQCVNQLVVAIENGRINYSRDRITYALHNLAKIIEARVPKHPPSN